MVGVLGENFLESRKVCSWFEHIVEESSFKGMVRLGGKGIIFYPLRGELGVTWGQNSLCTWKTKRMFSPLKFLPIHVYLKALNMNVKQQLQTTSGLEWVLESMANFAHGFAEKKEAWIIVRGRRQRKGKKGLRLHISRDHHPPLKLEGRAPLLTQVWGWTHLAEAQPKTKAYLHRCGPPGWYKETLGPTGLVPGFPLAPSSKESP